MEILIKFILDNVFFLFLECFHISNYGIKEDGKDQVERTIFRGPLIYTEINRCASRSQKTVAVS